MGLLVGYKFPLFNPPSTPYLYVSGPRQVHLGSSAGLEKERKERREGGTIIKVPEENPPSLP